MSRHALTGAALAAALTLWLACAAPAAPASTRVPMYFDAGSAAVRDSTRETTLARLDALGVRALRLTLVWAAVAPAAGSTVRPAFDAADPNAYNWGGYGDRKRSVPPLLFLRGVYCAGCAKLRVDGWAHHPYANRRGPFSIPPDRDNVTIGVMKRLEVALTRAVHRPLAVWVTEFGVQSAPDTTLGVPLAQQAEYRSISERILRTDHRIAATSQYLLTDDEALSGFQSGLITAAGRAKPSLDEFRMPLTVRRDGTTALLWGLIRPASGATRVEVLVRDRGSARSAAVATRPTDAGGTWTARLPWHAGRTWRVRWTAPDGATYVGPPVRVYG